MTKKEAIRLQIAILKDKSEQKTMQLTDSGVLYCTGTAIIRIAEELAVLELPELDLKKLFKPSKDLRPAKPTVYRAILGGDIGRAVKFEVVDDDPVWINQLYYNLLKGLAEYWGTDGKKLCAYGDGGLMAVIAPIRMSKVINMNE